MKHDLGVGNTVSLALAGTYRGFMVEWSRDIVALMTKWIVLALVAAGLASVRMGVVGAGHPLFVDCGGLDAETCEESIDMFFTPRNGGFLPDYIGFSVHPHFAGRPCGDYVLHGWILGRATYEGQPLC